MTLGKEITLLYHILYTVQFLFFRYEKGARRLMRPVAFVLSGQGGEGGVAVVILGSQKVIHLFFRT